MAEKKTYSLYECDDCGRTLIVENFTHLDNIRFNAQCPYIKSEFRQMGSEPTRGYLRFIKRVEVQNV